MHPWRLFYDRFPRFQSQLAPELPRPAQEPVAAALSLALVGEVVTVAAKEVLPGRVELPHPLSTAWADKPGTLAAEVARCPGEPHFVADQFTPIEEIAELNNRVRQGTDSDATYFLLSPVPADRAAGTWT